MRRAKEREAIVFEIQVVRVRGRVVGKQRVMSFHFDLVTTVAVEITNIKIIVNESITGLRNKN